MDIQYYNDGKPYILINTWLTDSKIENIVRKASKEIEVRSEKREIEKKQNKLIKF